MPVRCVLRWAIDQEIVATNPAAKLRIPPADGPRDRVVSASEATALIAALPNADSRALGATAIYGGLRRGELRALRWEDVDLATGIINVSRAWDARNNRIPAPLRPMQSKSRLGLLLRVYGSTKPKALE